MKPSSAWPRRAWVVAFVALLAIGPFAALDANATGSPGDLEYLLPLIKANAGLPTQVAMARDETVNFRDPKTSAGKTANLTAGSTHPLARVDGMKAVLKYEYSDTVIAGYRVRNSFDISESPEKELKTVTKQADVSVPLASTDIAERMIAALKFPPSVILAKDVVLPVVVGGRQVGTGPVKTGQSVAIVDVKEASGQLEVDFKGTQRGTIDISATEWDAALAELRRRQGTPASDPLSTEPAPPPTPMVETTSQTPPETMSLQPETPPSDPPVPAPPAPTPLAMADAASVDSPPTPPAPTTPSGEASDPASAGMPKPQPSIAETTPPIDATSNDDAKTPADGTTPSSGGPLPTEIILIIALVIVAGFAVTIGLSLAVRARSRRKKRKPDPRMAELLKTIAPTRRARSFAQVEPTMRDTLPDARRPMTPEREEMPTVKKLRPGDTVFGRYTLKRFLGRGGMGVVWEAVDGSLDQDVALKFLPDIVCHDPAALDDLKRETRRCLRLTHPNIVRIFDFVSDEESAGIAMELIDGPTLAASRLGQPNGVFTAADLVPWIKELCLALDYAHIDAKVVHRDLKPANLMVTLAGRLKVTDFGVARSVADSVSRVSIKTSTSGTIAFMSPQQAMGEQPSISDDVYAVGATLFQLLAGTPPFYSGEVFMQLLHKPAPTVAERRRESAIEEDGVPEHWEAVIAACLSKDPAERPASAGEVAERLGV